MKRILDGDLGRTRAQTATTNILTANLSWTLLMIIILLNELDDTWSRGATACVLQRGSRRDCPGPYIRFLSECDTTLERWLEFKIYLGNWSLKVEELREWILME
jgi:hypothetical protein